MIRAKTAADNKLLARVWADRYGGITIVSRGRAHNATELPGLVAADGDGALAGAVTWHRDGDEFEIVTLDSYFDNRGTGTELLNAVVTHAKRSGGRRVWLVTTNDNIRAIRFYQKRGWTIAAFHKDAVTKARKLKPEISLVGNDGIPIRHEIEFELVLR